MQEVTILNSVKVHSINRVAVTANIDISRKIITDNI